MMKRHETTLPWLSRFCLLAFICCHLIQGLGAVVLGPLDAGAAALYLIPVLIDVVVTR